jgi:hypothetical protein
MSKKKKKVVVVRKSLYSPIKISTKITAKCQKKKLEEKEKKYNDRGKALVTFVSSLPKG